jgi:ABC-type Zn uptake system ZnuABC Zn-binding protein ZnuA
MRRFLPLFVVSCGALGFLSCNGATNPWAARPGPKVLAYFPPLYSLAATVGGDDAQVLSLITHAGPHDYEPKPRDARLLQNADLFLTVGLGLDDSVSRKLAASSSNKSLKRVALGELLPKDVLVEGTCSCGHKHQHDEKHEDGEHHHVEYDPHVWLGPAEAATMAQAIAQELAAIDSQHAAGYQARAAALAARLAKLQTDGRDLLAAKTEKPKVISYHGSLNYFARSFGIDVVDSLEAPGQEPSSSKITKLIETCQKYGARLIAVEPQYPSNTGAKVLLQELKRKGIDAAFVEIDPLETADPTQLTPDYYERKMWENIKRLADVLK